MSFSKTATLKRRLIRTFALVLFIPTLLITWISYNNTKEKIADEQLNSTMSSMQLLNEHFDNLIQPKLKQADFLSSYLSANDASEQLTSILEEYLAMHDDVTVAYIGTTSGEMVRRPYFEYDKSYDPRERDWYKQALANEGETIITDPYISASSGELVVTIARQLDDKSGVYGMDLSIQTLINITNSVAIGKKGFITLIDQAGNYISAPNKEAGTAAKESYIQSLSKENPVTAYKDYTVTFTPNELTGWHFYGNIVNKEAVQAAQSSLWATIGILLICVILVAGTVYLLVRSVMRPIRALSQNAIAISEGDLATKIVPERNDEIGKLATTFEQMRQNLLHLVTKVHESSINVANSSDDLHSNAVETTAATELSAASVQQIAVTLDTQMGLNEENVQIIATMEQDITYIASQTREANELAKQATNEAEQGSKMVEQTVNQMTTIAESVEKSDHIVRALSTRIDEIDSIVDVITEIANQTNLLALNASIEAARAGEYGKGFAVVAQEVGKLAAHSKQSTEKISALITSIQQDTTESVTHMESVKLEVKDGIALTDQTAHQFSAIAQHIQAVTPMMSHIAEHTQNLASAAEEATASTTNIASQSQENAAAVEEIAAITEQIHHSMEEIDTTTKTLKQLSDTLHSEINRFDI